MNEWPEIFDDPTEFVDVWPEIFDDLCFDLFGGDES